MKENIPPNIRKKQCTEMIKTPQMVWDVSANDTSVIFSDMGVQPVSDDSNDSLAIMEKVSQESVCKKNYKLQIRDSGNKNLDLSTNSIKTWSEILRNDDNFLCRRKSFDSIPGKEYFNDVSDEMILAIFQWLPKFSLLQCALVCKRWSILVLDESLWRRMDLSNRSLRPGIIGKLFDRGVYALRLSKTDISTPIFSIPYSSLSSERLAKVQFLDLSMATVSENGLEQILSVCCDLKKLSLENCSLNTSICCCIGTNQYLEELNLSMCSGLLLDGALHLFPKIQRLKSLNVSWTGLDRHTVMYITTTLSRDLRKLNFGGFRATLKDEDIQKILEVATKLVELDVSDALLLTEDTINIINAYQPNLEYLAINRCYRIPCSCLVNLKGLRSLRALDIFGIVHVDEHLTDIQDALPSVGINKYPLSSIARPTTGIRRTSIWGIRVRDCFA